MARQVQSDTERDKKELEDSFQRLSEQAQRKVRRCQEKQKDRHFYWKRNEMQDDSGRNIRKWQRELFEKSTQSLFDAPIIFSVDTGTGRDLGNIEERAHCQQTGASMSPEHC